jgi:F-box protein 18 (helicase)
MAEQLWMMMADTQNSEIGMLHDGYLKLYQLSNPILDFDCVLLDEAQVRRLYA